VILGGHVSSLRMNFTYYQIFELPWPPFFILGLEDLELTFDLDNQTNYWNISIPTIADENDNFNYISFISNSDDSDLGSISNADSDLFSNYMFLEFETRILSIAFD
jgi:hypothetical protein